MWELICFLLTFSLGHLELGNNFFTGIIPSELGRIKSLKNKLDLSHNQLSGILPAELGLLVDLSKFLFVHNTTA